MLRIIYTEAELLLSKREWTSLREIRDAVPGYKTSLGPRAFAEIAQFLPHPVTTTLQRAGASSRDASRINWVKVSAILLS